MSRPLRRLTEAGRSAFREWLDRGGVGDPPRQLLDDPETSAPVGQVIEIPEQEFEDRYAMGVFLVGILESLDVAAVRFDAGMWDWLALHLIDIVAPMERDGSREMKSRPLYSLEENKAQRRYRHLLYSAWFLVREHGSNARFMLAGKPHEHGDAAEQMMGRQEVIGSTAIVQAACDLYWDVNKQQPKKGCTNRNSAGNVRRYPYIVRQFLLTYDLPTMTPEWIMDLLPDEFGRWRRPSQAARPRAGRTTRRPPPPAAPPPPPR